MKKFLYRNLAIIFEVKYSILTTWLGFFLLSTFIKSPYSFTQLAILSFIITISIVLFIILIVNIIINCKYKK